MPDWSYRTILKPLLERIAGRNGARVVVRGLAGLAAMPLGSRVLDFFGHMAPDPRLAVTVAGRRWSTPLGLGCRLDPTGVALSAWDRFGVGFVELGPVTFVRRADRAQVEVHSVGADPEDAVPQSLEAWCVLLARRRTGAVPVWVRLAPGDPDTVAAGVMALIPLVAGFVVEVPETALESEWQGVLEKVVALVRRAEGGGGALVALAVTVKVDAESNVGFLRERLQLALRAGAQGVWVSSAADIPPGSGDSRGLVTAELGDRLRLAREGAGPSALLVAAGVDSPRSAVVWREAGADLVVADRGLLSSGPGLPKRINAALLYSGWDSSGEGNDRQPARPEAASRRAWFWGTLLGVGMLAGGMLASGIAMTRVVLPYDEVFCSTTREGLAAINPRLLPFMAHDRVTLAGTMVSIGILYLGLSWHGVRRGAHWAKVTVVSSSVTGFFSFFLFLGFGYLDPFHAFVTGVLFQFLLLTLYARLGSGGRPPRSDLEDTAAWRRGQWGQLLLVLLGAGLMAAGVVIAGIGITRVLVREDLEFLGTSVSALRSANPRLIALVAHDRASLGGMLLANGLAVWLAAQWGCAGGARWLWWTFLLAGIPAFAAAIGVHLAVGYTDLWHLAPAILAAAVFVAALGLTREWLCDPSRDLEDAWDGVRALRFWKRRA